MSIILKSTDVKDSISGEYKPIVYTKEGIKRYILTKDNNVIPISTESFESIIEGKDYRINLINILQVFDTIKSDVEKYILLYVYNITKIMIDNDYKVSEFKDIEHAIDMKINETSLIRFKFKERYLIIAKNMFDIALKRYVVEKKTDWSKVKKYGKIFLTIIPVVNRFMTEGVMASDTLTPDFWNKLENIEKKFRDGEGKISENELKAFSSYNNNDEKITSMYYIHHKENFKKEHINKDFSLITCILLLLNHLNSNTEEELELVKLLVHKIYSEHIISMRKIVNNIVSS